MPHASDRFQGAADRYASARPDYPERLLTVLSGSILGDASPAAGLVVDVGSGTGIFTRQLRASLPAAVPIVGIEPASDMRSKADALSAGVAGIAYRDGLAQKLPIETAGARAVVAATAAHWFDRPDFYRESHRVLIPSGILAIVEYVRDDERSAAAAAVVEFLARYGGPRAYARPDYTAELRQAEGFREFAHLTQSVTLMLSSDAFTGLALSSSHARAAIDALGGSAARQMLLQMVTSLVTSDGRIPYGYVFHLFTVRRH